MTPQARSRHGIGGSDAAVPAALHPYKPPITLWQELLGQIPAFAGNDATHWGCVLEEPIRDEYLARHNVEVWVPPASMFHDSLDWARATPDGLVVREGTYGEAFGWRESWEYGLEIKTCGAHSAHRWGAPGTDEIPIEYLCQGAWYCWVCSLPRWEYAVLIGGQDYREYVYHRDADLEELLVDSCRDFWGRYVLTGDPPPVDATREYGEYINRRWPHARDDYASTSPEIDVIAANLRQVQSEQAQLARRRSALENELRMYISDTSGIRTSEGRVHWKPRAGGVSWKAIAEELAAAAGVEMDEIKERHRLPATRPMTYPDWRNNG